MSSEHVTLIAAVVFLLVFLRLLGFASSRTQYSNGHQRAERRERDWYPS
jgi:hypothetical protein